MWPPKWWISIIKSCSPSCFEGIGHAATQQATQTMHPGPVITLLILLTCSPPGEVRAIDTPSDLARLQLRSEEAMAQGDPRGAAISMGKAALLASQLDRQGLSNSERPYPLMAEFFRTQEHVYHAIALFQENGGQVPASSGVCILFTLGRQRVLRAREHDDATGAASHSALYAQLGEWLEIIQELQRDWECGKG